LVPLHAVLKFDSGATEDVQRTADSQVHFATAQLLDEFQILDGPASTSIGDRDVAPFGELGNKFVVDAALEPFYICSVYQELGAIWLE
jgi:hypothetical protein